jgi:outer membrane protein
MNRKLTGLLMSALLTVGALHAQIGVVNFKQCIEDSKLGKQEQATFDQMRQQMANSLEKVQKEMQEVGTKMSDKEYMDGLSSDAQTDLRNKFQTLNNELVQNQTQYYQILNQAHMRLVQGLMDEVGGACQSVAKDMNLKLVMVPEMSLTAPVAAVETPAAGKTKAAEKGKDKVKDKAAAKSKNKGN